MIASIGLGISSAFTFAAFALSSSALVGDKGKTTFEEFGLNCGLPETEGVGGAGPSAGRPPRAIFVSLPLGMCRTNTSASPPSSGETVYARYLPSGESVTPVALRQAS